MRDRFLGCIYLGLKPQSHSELHHIFHFLPISYITYIVIPVTNWYAKKNNPKWIDLDIDEFLHALGILLAMEIYDSHGPQCLYWLNSEHTLFPSMKFGEVMSIKIFENTSKYLLLSENENEE